MSTFYFDPMYFEQNGSLSVQLRIAVGYHERKLHFPDENSYLGLSNSGLRKSDNQKDTQSHLDHLKSWQFHVS